MNLLMGKMYYCTDSSIDYIDECYGTFAPPNDIAEFQYSKGAQFTPSRMAKPIDTRAPIAFALSERHWIRHGSHFDNFVSTIVT